MTFRQLLFVGFLLMMASPVWAANRYASAGGGNGPVGCTVNANDATACHLRAGLLAMTPGDVLILKNGEFKGNNGMLDPQDGVSGTANNPITVKAENPGQVLINGEYLRVPIHLAFNEYWIIEDINAKNSSADVLLLDNGANFNKFRRLVVWNADPNSNAYVVRASGTNSYNLIEDVGAFGTGRKTFGDTQLPAHNTFRRVWGQWEHTDCGIGCPGNGPNTTFELNYADTYITIENGIFTWDERGTPPTPYGIFSRTGGSITTNRDIFARYLGNIVYVKSGLPFSTDIAVRSGLENQILFKDLAIFIPPSGSGIIPINLFECTEPVVAPDFAKNPCNMTDTPVIDMKVTNLSVIGGNGDLQIDGDWVQTNVVQGATNAAVYGSQSLFQNDGTKGATICYQYVDGTLTNTPLWPWPMDQRIYDAMVLAAVDDGRTPIHVTTVIEGMYGTIPPECRSDSGSGGTNLARWVWDVTAYPGATQAAAAIAMTGSAIGIANHQAGSFSSGSASQTIASFNVPAGTNRMLAVCAASDVDLTGITFGAAALTKLTGNLTTDNAVGLWYLKNPSVSTANIVSTAAGAWKGVINAYALTNVEQTATFTDFGSTAASGTNSIQVALAAATSTDFLTDCVNVRNEDAAATTLTPNVGVEGTDFGYSPSGRGSSRTLTPLSSPTIIVTAPILASIQKRPQMTTVAWTTSDISSGTVDLTYSFDGFVTSYPIATGVAYNASAYVFTPTWPAQPSMQVKVCQGSACGTSAAFVTRGYLLK